MNNREYRTDVTYARKDLAQESAATRAYMICRNFSANDGMYPGQRLEAGAQGMPVAIGAGRKGCSGGRTVAGAGDGRVSGSGVQYMQQQQQQQHEGTYSSDGSGSAGSRETRHKRESSGSLSEASTLSGGESPRSVDSAVAFGAQSGGAVQKTAHAQVARPPHYQPGPAPCKCRRGLCVLRHERCWMCLRDAGWIA